MHQPFSPADHTLRHHILHFIREDRDPSALLGPPPPPSHGTSPGTGHKAAQGGHCYSDGRPKLPGALFRSGRDGARHWPSAERRPPTRQGRPSLGWQNRGLRGTHRCQQPRVSTDHRGSSTQVTDGPRGWVTTDHSGRLARVRGTGLYK